MSISKLDQLEAKLADAEAKEAALHAVLQNKTTAPTGVDDGLFAMYSRISAASRETQLNAITATILVLNQQIAAFRPPTAPSSGNEPTPPVNDLSLLTERMDSLSMKMSKMQLAAQPSSSTFQTHTEYFASNDCSEVTRMETTDADAAVKALWADLQQDDLKTESKVQTVWTAHCSRLQTDDTKLFDGSNKPTVDSRKPDIVTCHPDVAVPDALTVLKVVELKAPEVSLLSGDVLSQAADVLVRILLRQRLRPQATALLNNGKTVVLLRCSRKPNTLDDFSFSRTPVFTGDTARDHIMHHLRSDECVSVSVAGKRLVKYRWLGEGAHCEAFAVHSGNDEMVLKVYKKDVPFGAKHEVGLLQDMHAILENFSTKNLAMIPLVVAEENHLLLVKPKGRYFRRRRSAEHNGRELRAPHIEQLVETLRIIHDKGYVHRDVRPANFFLFENHVLLNDWGAAVERDHTPLTHSGCPPAFCHFDSTKPHHVSPQDDLYSLVLSIYLIMNVEKGEVDLPPMKLPPLYEEMKTAALNLQYDQIIELAKSVVHE